MKWKLIVNPPPPSTLMAVEILERWKIFLKKILSDRFKINIFLSERSVKFSISGLFFYQEPFHANMVTDLPYAKLGFDIFAFHRSVDPVDPDDKGKYTI